MFVTSRVINLLVFFAVHHAGRAGRVSPGTCYRIVPRDFYEEFIPEFGIPEMQVSAPSTLERVTYFHIVIYCNNLQTLLGIHELRMRCLSGCSPFTHNMNNDVRVCKQNTCSHSNETSLSSTLQTCRVWKSYLELWLFKYNISFLVLWFLTFFKEKL